jgi:hypothetical protein
LWEGLPLQFKNEVEQRSAVEFPQERFMQVVDSGSFFRICSPQALARLISDQPDLWFDGVVFRPSVKLRPPEAQARITGAVARALESVAAFQQDELLRGRHEIKQVQLSLDLIEAQVVDSSEA